MNKLYKGILFSLAGTAMFTPVFAAGKISGGMYPAIALMTLRFVGGFITILCVTILSRTKFSDIKSPQLHLHFIRALLGTGSGISAIHAATIIPVAYATSISLTQGVILIALAGIFLKEKITKNHWVACLISMFGALIIVSQSLDFSNSSNANLVGVLAAFASAAFIAVEVLFIKVLARREHALGVLLYVNGLGMLIMICISLAFLDYKPLMKSEFFAFIVLGPLAILGQFFNIKAYRQADASVLAPVSYSWIIFATILGLFFNEMPTFAAFLGALLIFTGGLFIAAEQKPQIKTDTKK